MKIKAIYLCLLLFLCSSANRVLAEPSLRVGVASMITPLSAVNYYQQIIDYLGSRLDSRATLVHRTTYDEIDTMLERGELDLAFICSAPYVLDHRAFGVRLLAVPQVQGETTYHAEIIVHRDSPITSFAELKGRRFSFVDPKSNTGYLYPVFLLARSEQDPEQFFSNISYSYSHNKSVEMVAKNKVDGASVDSVVYRFLEATDSPYVKQTRVIHRSPDFGMPPVVVPAHLDSFRREQILQSLLTMHEDPAGRAILAQMQIDRFVVPDDGDYDSIRAMLAYVENSRKNRPEDDVEPRSTTGQEDNGAVHFGVLPRENPRIAYERYQGLVEYLSRKLGRSVELALAKNYPGVVDALGEGKLDFAVLDPLTYLDAHVRYGLQPLVRGKSGSGQLSYNSAIVAADDSDIDRLEDLEGRKFAFGPLWSTAGNLMPRYLLARAGIHLNSLGGYQNFGFSETVVKKVLTGEFSAGAIRLSAAQRYVPRGLKILAASEPIPSGPVVSGADVSEQLREQVKDALLDLSDLKTEQATLARFNAELQGGFAPAGDGDYQGVREMINSVPTGCGIGCHPKRSF